ncbi:RNA 2',3'-cyclic phosphodiesterase [Caballeronia sp. LZ062]|uniref:RNA 2',3'-cyclic phosphodiesterase n=1 Tax=unclassified Caballeronia TaxID=2646786 RepID=UPI002863183D|nr:MULTISPECIES: RNA 2',3'-cyclic phosphodiesterase [unclassified Caballeronia]MDR5854361.1 RNA 2',3'-cyclic phosphodiesterase [Caballeronia sp. LZ050]MDR5871108.1 RNA 2',3'-cyclic phosphodiesterase [Caballeronia sp. LZ062]
MDTPTANRSTDSLFFAVYPDAAAAARIGEHALRLRTEHPLKARPIPADRLHITLHYLGAFAGVPADTPAAALAAASSVHMPSFDVTLDRVETFATRRPKRPLVIAGEPDDAFSAFVDRLDKALQSAGIFVKSHPRFIPHVTLLYDEHRVSRHAVEPITWTVREFALVRSLLGRSEHQVIERWPLGA